MLFSNLIVLGFFVHYLYQRYCFHAYSFYLIYPAIGIYAIYLLIIKFIKDEKYVRYREITFGLLIALILFISIPFTFFENLFTLKMYSNVYINDKMAEYTFYPYRDACKYVRKNIKPDEEVLCVMPRIAEFYIDRDIKVLRQVRINLNRFNVADEFIEDTTVYENSLENHPSFINFIQTHKSGWVITDTRIKTAISAATQDFIFYQMDIHLLGSVPMGLMFVTHWDSNTISKEPYQMFLFLNDLNVSENFSVGSLNNIDPNSIIEITVIYSGVEMPNEALCTVGDVLQDYLPPNIGLGKVYTASSYVRTTDLKTGNIKFTYNANCGDPTRGFIIHNILVLR
jgi:hypothetical protein